MQPFGFTRSSLQVDHALIAPDTHVRSPLVGWHKASAIVHIAPAIGARFTQYTAMLEAGAVSGPPLTGAERFVFVCEGTVELRAPTSASLNVGGYAYLPAGLPHEIRAAAPAKLVVFEKRYQPLPSGQTRVIIGHENDVAAEPYLGDPDARLQTLLPVEPAFDMAVNLFTYQPGATLPQVEIHVMEHGLIMLNGAGIYRLGNCWYPVRAGDVIWMKAYCPQWFVAMGKEPARYLYYKDIHRDPLEVA